MQIDGEIRLSPAWKHALSVLVDDGLQDGQIITKEKLSELFGLKKPVTAEEQERYQFEYMNQFSCLRDELLEDHRIALRTMYGEGSYQVVPPNNQTDLAMQEAQKEMKKAAKKMARTLAFIRIEALTNDERKKNADAQAKAAMLAGMVRNQLQIKTG